MLEIERKFIVTEKNSWLGSVRRSDKFVQGYFDAEQATIRIRIMDAIAFLTIKSALFADQRTRFEFEYEIPLDDAHKMLDQFCGDRVIVKTRHQIIYQGNHWVIDQFEKPSTDLMFAEIELDSPEQGFVRPPWLGKEVTDDPRFSNQAIAIHGIPA